MFKCKTLNTFVVGVTSGNSSSPEDPRQADQSAELGFTEALVVNPPQYTTAVFTEHFQIPALSLLPHFAISFLLSLFHSCVLVPVMACLVKWAAPRLTGGIILVEHSGKAACCDIAAVFDLFPLAGPGGSLTPHTLEPAAVLQATPSTSYCHFRITVI